MDLIPGLGRCPGGGQPTPVFLAEESHGQRSLAGYSPWGCKKLDTTKTLTIHAYIIYILYILVQILFPHRLLQNIAIVPCAI